MGNKQHIWTRLLWKEMREGWQVVLISLIAPVVLFPLANRYETWVLWRGVLAIPAAAGIHLAIALWAAAKGSSKRQGTWYLMSQLPVTPIPEWLTSLVVPLIVTGALGLWYGFWAAGIGNYQALTSALCGALDLATTYAVCYLIALVISNWAAIIFGAFRLMGGTLISVWTLQPSLMDDVVGYVMRTTIGAVVGSFIFVVLSQKKSLAFRQAMALLSVIVIVFAPAIKGLQRDWGIISENQRQHGATILSGGRAQSDTSNMEVKEIVPKNRNGKVWFMAGSIYPVSVMTGSLVADSGKKHGFDQDTQVILITEQDRVYLLQQVSPKSPVSVIEWNYKTDKVQTIASIKSRRSLLLAVGDGESSFISPDGRYLLFFLKSMMGNGLDLWALDISSRRCEVVIPGLVREKDSSAIDQIGWNGNVATCVMSDGKLITIDFKTMMTRELAVAEGR